MDSSATGYNMMVTDKDMTDNMSIRYKMWEDFAREVGDHVETYTVPEYGDFPTDGLTTWSVEDLKIAMSRYLSTKRLTKRPTNADDMLKIAHYASVAWHKINDSEQMYKPGFTVAEFKLDIEGA